MLIKINIPLRYLVTLLQGVAFHDFIQKMIKGAKSVKCL